MENSIKGVVPHILCFIVNELCVNCFRLAQERELSDLKGWVDPESNSDWDYELLGALDDEVIKKVMVSVDKGLVCLQTYFMINNLDEVEVYENEEYSAMASESYLCYAEDSKLLSYEELVQNLNMVYISIAHMLYHTTCQLEQDEINIPEIDYEAVDDRYSDILSGKVESDDRNVTLLYDLMISLDLDLSEITRRS